MKNNNVLRYLVVVILTTAMCWVMFNASLRVESVHQTDNGYTIEVTVCGQTQVHRVDNYSTLGVKSQAIADCEHHITNAEIVELFAK